MNLRQEVKEIKKDIKNLKLKAYEPDKTHARFFLEHLYSEDTTARRNMEKYYAREFELFNEWAKVYCEEHGCSQESALRQILEE